MKLGPHTPIYLRMEEVYGIVSTDRGNHKGMCDSLSIAYKTSIDEF